MLLYKYSSFPLYKYVHQGHIQGMYKWIYAPKIAKIDLTIDADYVAILVNVNMWL